MDQVKSTWSSPQAIPHRKREIESPTFRASAPTGGTARRINRSISGVPAALTAWLGGPPPRDPQHLTLLTYPLSCSPLKGMNCPAQGSVSPSLSRNSQRLETDRCKTDLLLDPGAWVIPFSQKEGRMIFTV